MAFIALIGIFGNKHIRNIQFTVLLYTIGIVNIGMPEAQRLDFGSRQFQAGGKFFGDFIIKMRPAVLRNAAGADKIRFAAFWP